MTETHEVFAPLINPNEPEARIVAVHVSEGQWISVGDALCTLETTKSTVVVQAEYGGYVKGLDLKVGSNVRANTRLCWLAQSSDWQVPQEIMESSTEDNMLPENLRITIPALEFAHQKGIDLSSLPRGSMITEEKLRKIVGARNREDIPIPDGPFHANSLVIYGGGGHAKSIIDLIRVLGRFEIIGIVDDGMQPGTELMEIGVLGGGDILPLLFAVIIERTCNGPSMSAASIRDKAPTTAIPRQMPTARARSRPTPKRLTIQRGEKRVRPAASGETSPAIGVPLGPPRARSFRFLS